MAAPSPPAAPSPSWVILCTTPLVGLLDRPGDVFISPLDVPPRVSLLTLSPGVFPSTVDPRQRLKLPVVKATDPSAGLLLAVIPPPPPPPPAPPSSSDDNEPAIKTLRRPVIPAPEHVFVLDVTAATATSIPLDPSGVVYDWANLGVIAAPDGAPGFMLAEFDHFRFGRGATLACFSSETGVWVEKRFSNLLPPRIWRGTFDDVIAHDAKLWWVDADACLVACDPFADKPQVLYVPLPKHADADDSDDSDRPYYGVYSVGFRRCVQVSNGKFRCVDVNRARQDRHGGAPTITMRTLADPQTAEWTLDYEIRFEDDIWAGATCFKASQLPQRPPVLALIHPENPDVLYFFVNDDILGVNMRARRVVEREIHERAKGASPSSVLPFVLPPGLRAGLHVEVSDDKDVKEDGPGKASSCLSCIGL